VRLDVCTSDRGLFNFFEDEDASVEFEAASTHFIFK